MFMNLHKVACGLTIIVFASHISPTQLLWELFGPNNEKFHALSCVSRQSSPTCFAKNFQHKDKLKNISQTLEDNSDNNHYKGRAIRTDIKCYLFEVKESNGQQFHFRIQMENTTSFRHLDWNMQQH